MKINLGFDLETERVPNDEELSHMWNVILQHIDWDESVHVKNIKFIDSPMRLFDCKDDAECTLLKMKNYHGVLEVEFEREMINGEYLFKRILQNLGFDTLRSALIEMESDYIILVVPKKSNFEFITNDGSGESIYIDMDSETLKIVSPLESSGSFSEGSSNNLNHQSYNKKRVSEGSTEPIVDYGATEEPYLTTDTDSSTFDKSSFYKSTTVIMGDKSTNSADVTIVKANTETLAMDQIDSSTEEFRSILTTVPMPLASVGESSTGNLQNIGPIEGLNEIDRASGVNEFNPVRFGTDSDTTETTAYTTNIITDGSARTKVTLNVTGTVPTTLADTNIFEGTTVQPFDEDESGEIESSATYFTTNADAVETTAIPVDVTYFVEMKSSPPPEVSTIPIFTKQEETTHTSLLSTKSSNFQLSGSGDGTPFYPTATIVDLMTIESSVGESSGGESSGGESSTAVSFAGEGSAGASSTGVSFAGESSAGESSTDESSVGEIEVDLKPTPTTTTTEEASGKLDIEDKKMTTHIIHSTSETIQISTMAPKLENRTSIVSYEGSGQEELTDDEDFPPPKSPKLAFSQSCNCDSALENAVNNPNSDFVQKLVEKIKSEIYKELETKILPIIDNRLTACEEKVCRSWNHQICNIKIIKIIKLNLVGFVR